jgi:hypothetical protein
MSQTQILASLDLLKKCDCQPGTDMEKAHQICQEHEGSPLYDWVHALIHRIEGDDANAAYWYRRAGRTRHSGSVEEELRNIQSAVDSDCGATR